MICNHEDRRYVKRWKKMGGGKYNGAYYYSVEICKYIIPNVKTDRNWITINVPHCGIDHAIVIIHNNLHPENYEWMSMFDDLVLVCGVPETCAKVAHLGQPIYLPLSVKVSEVEQYRTEKTKEIAYVGRKGKRNGISFPIETEFIEELPRPELLKRIAQYKKVFAVGRTAIEAKILGCEILPYDERYPNPDRWKVVDSSKAAKILQTELDMIDGG